VEVYFPRIGWVRFDPTPGNTENGQVRTSLPAGRPVPTPTPRPGASPSPVTGPVFVGDLDGLDEGPGASFRPDEVPSDAGGGGILGNPIVIGAIVVALVAVAGLLLWNRRRRFWFPSPEAAWAGIVRPASRLGFGPRPSQTVYEYAGMLEDVLPEVSPELREVAVARVEATYGHRETSGVRLNALRQAYRRVRRYLLLLVLPSRRRR
jgi:hypothetical protein